MNKLREQDLIEMDDVFNWKLLHISCSQYSERLFECLADWNPTIFCSALAPHRGYCTYIISVIFFQINFQSWTQKLSSRTRLLG